MSVNFRVLRREIVSQAPKVVARAEPYLQQRFEDKKKDFLKKFDEHEVTQEIQRGPNTRESILPVGNLFSLLGFEASQHPTTPLRAFLKKGISLEKKTDLELNSGRIFARKRVFIPTLDEVNKAAAEQTPITDWSDRGWTDEIERGIPGFPRFLSILTGEKDRKKRRELQKSRSGTAIQVKTSNLREGSTGKISYIGGLLAAFKSIISKNKH